MSSDADSDPLDHLRNYLDLNCYLICAPKREMVPVPVRSPLLLPVSIIFLKHMAIALSPISNGYIVHPPPHFVRD